MVVPPASFAPLHTAVITPPNPPTHYGSATLGELAAYGLGESAGLLVTGVPADYGYGDEFIGCSWHTAGFSLHALKSVRAAQLAVPSDHTIAEERAFAASDGAISVRWVTMKALMNFPSPTLRS